MADKAGPEVGPDIGSEGDAGVPCGSADIRREALWLIAGQALSALGGLVAIRVVTRVFPAEVYGVSWLFINGVGLAVMLLANPVGETLNRFYHDCTSQGELDTLLGLVFRLQVGISVVAAVLYWGTVLIAGWWRGVASLAVAILPIYFFFLAALGTAQLLLNSARRRRGRVLLAVAEAWLKPAGAVLLGAVWGPSVNSMVIGYAAASVITGIAGIFMLRGFGEIRFAASRDAAADLHARIGAYGLPLIGFAAAGWLLSLGDRYLVNAFLGAALTGVYVASYQVGAALFQFLGGVFGPLVQPLIFARTQRRGGGAEAISDSVRIFAWLSFPILAVFVVTHGWLLRGLAAPEYWGGTATVLFVGFGVYFSALGDRFMQVFLATRSTRPVMIIRAIAAAANVLLNVLLIPRAGIVGAAVSTTLSYALYALAMWFWGRRLLVWEFPTVSFVRAALTAGSAGSAGILAHRILLHGAYDVISALVVLGVFAAVLAASAWAVRRRIGVDLRMVLKG